MNTSSPRALASAAILLGALCLFLLGASLYIIDMREQAIVTQFGRPVGEPVTEAGLHLKLPFIQKVNKLEKRVLEWDGQVSEMPTKDKLYIVIDTFARWRISDPLQYFQRLRDERSARSRLDDILGSETRNVVAKHELIEMVRTTKDRQPQRDESLEKIVGEPVTLYPIQRGRSALEKELFEQASAKLRDFGIDLLDIRFKRINYNQAVSEKIYERMISERQQIAARFRSEGEGEAARIHGKKGRDLKEIESEAYRKVQGIQGEADAKATDIYARAYNQSEEAARFYEFMKVLETYEKILDPATSMILSTKSELFRLLKDAGDRPASGGGTVER